MRKGPSGEAQLTDQACCIAARMTRRSTFSAPDEMLVGDTATSRVRRSPIFPSGDTPAQPFRPRDRYTCAVAVAVSCQVSFATRFRRQGMKQKTTGSWISGDHLLDGALVVALRLLSGPFRAARQERFEVKGAVG